MMGNDLTRRAHALLTKAMEIADPDERRSFVDEACGEDVELRERMQALLRALEEEPSFLETPALERSAEGAIPSPAVIGGYQIVRAIGVGGMATVYEAMQEHPQRRVALKVMRHALTQTSAVERFRFETEVLASLRHPCIAQIYEASASDDGHGVSTPYFAMEFIPDALPVTAYAKSHEMSLQDRLEMLLPILDAVHHGHQLGVIHRDLKPGNILVDGEGNPKVIDFGIARSADPKGERLTQEDSGERIIGTLNYMSPEQHEGVAAGLDIRTDIYSLGALLYELVCERLPHDLTNVGFADAARIVRDASPDRPSAVKPQVKGDLEAVMLKALDPDRYRRYQTVPQLAADIRRYLNNEPVLARPATTVYRLRKFAQRRRGLVTSIAAVSLAIVLGVIATARQAVIATHARDREREQRMLAEQREEELALVADFQSQQLADLDVRAMAEGMREEIVRRHQEAAAVADASEGLDSDSLQYQLDVINMIDVARVSVDEHLLECSREAIDQQFADQPLIRARLLFTLAGTANDLALWDRAEESLYGAIDIREAELGSDDPETLECVHALAALRLSQGRIEDSLPLMDRVVEGRRRSLGPEHPETLNAMSNRAHLLRRFGRGKEAEQVYRDLLAINERIGGPDMEETIEALNNLAVCLALQHELDEAGELWREALARRRRAYGPDHPHIAVLVANLGRMMMEKGQFEEAEPYLRESLEKRRERYGDDHPSTLAAAHSYGVSLRTLGRYEEAERQLNDVIARREQMIGAEHPNTLESRTALGDVYLAQERFIDAETIHRQTLEARLRVLGETSDSTFESMSDVSEALIGQERFEEALQLMVEAVAMARETFDEGTFRIGLLLGVQAHALVGLERWNEAAPVAIESYDIHVDAMGALHERTAGMALLTAEIHDALDALDPGAGHDAEAARWRERAAGDLTEESPAGR